MKQTAVEWLVEKLDQNFDYVADTIIEKAKEMEKQQTIDFGQEIVDDIAYDSQGKEWVADKYKETFKSE